MDIVEKQKESRKNLKHNIHVYLSDFAKKENPTEQDFKNLEEGINTFIDIYTNEKVNNIYQEISNDLHRICQ